MVNVCLEDYIFRGFHFLVEVTFNRFLQDVLYSVYNIKFDLRQTETIPEII